LAQAFGSRAGSRRALEIPIGSQGSACDCSLHLPAMLSGIQSFGGSQGAGLSQGMGASQGTQATQGAGRTPRQEDKATCIPVTVRTIESALVSRVDDGELQFFGTEPGTIVVVGVVEGLVSQTASLEFVLNDGTGRIKVKHYISGTRGVGQEAGLDGVSAGKYISVVGNVRTSPAVHIGALCLRLVESADEVSYHTIEAAHAALKLQRRGTTDPSTPAQKLGGSQDISSPLKVPEVAMRPAPAPTPPAAPATESSPLQGGALVTAVVELLRRESEGRPEGMALSTICAEIGKPASTDEVRGCLEKLVADGDAFTTIDDDHFSIL